LLSNQQTLNAGLDALDLVLELRLVIGQDGGRDDGARYTARTAEVNLVGHKHVGYVLAKKEEEEAERSTN
jgi:hypothetical protein